MVDPFTLSASGWSADAEDLPLSYTFLYAAAGALWPLGQEQYATRTPLCGYQVNPSLEALLPAGNGGVVSELDLFLRVRTAFGAETVVPAPVRVNVTWPSFTGFPAIEAFRDNLDSAATSAGQSGDSGSAFQLVGARHLFSRAMLR